MLHLRVHDSHGKRSMLFAGASVRIGTAPGAEIVVDAQGVAPWHAELSERDGRTVLRDLGTRSGTFIGKQRVTTGGTIIKPGTTFSIGVAQLTFQRPELPQDIEFGVSTMARAHDLPRLERQCREGDAEAAAVLYREAVRRNELQYAVWALPYATPSHTTWAAIVLALNARPRDDQPVFDYLDTQLAQRQWPDAIRTTPPEWFGNLLHGVPEPRFLLVRHLVVDERQIGPAFASALDTPWVEHLKRLEISGKTATGLELEALRLSDHLTGLTHLGFPGLTLRTAMLPALVAALDNLHTLTSLDLSRCGLTDEAIRQLVRMPQLKQLRRLDLRENQLGDDAASALARSANVVNLDHLDLRDNAITLDGIRKLRVSVRFKDGALRYS